MTDSMSLPGPSGKGVRTKLGESYYQLWYRVSRIVCCVSSITYHASLGQWNGMAYGASCHI
jgi:hypothetical protein